MLVEVLDDMQNGSLGIVQKLQTEFLLKCVPKLKSRVTSKIEKKDDKGKVGTKLLVGGEAALHLLQQLMAKSDVSQDDLDFFEMKAWALDSPSQLQLCEFEKTTLKSLGKTKKPVVATAASPSKSLKGGATASATPASSSSSKQLDRETWGLFG